MPNREETSPQCRANSRGDGVVPRAEGPEKRLLYASNDPSRKMQLVQYRWRGTRTMPNGETNKIGTGWKPERALIRY